MWFLAQRLSLCEQSHVPEAEGFEIRFPCRVLMPIGLRNSCLLVNDITFEFQLYVVSPCIYTYL